jgi:hypothetical protein
LVISESPMYLRPKTFQVTGDRLIVQYHLKLAISAANMKARFVAKYSYDQYLVVILSASVV